MNNLARTQIIKSMLIKLSSAWEGQWLFIYDGIKCLLRSLICFATTYISFPLISASARKSCNSWNLHWGPLSLDMRTNPVTENTHICTTEFVVCGVCHHQSWLPLSHAINVLKYFSRQNWCTSIKLAAGIIIIGALFPGTQNGDAWLRMFINNMAIALSTQGNHLFPRATPKSYVGDALAMWRLRLVSWNCPGWQTKGSVLRRNYWVRNNKQGRISGFWWSEALIRLLFVLCVCVFAAWQTSSYPHVEPIELCSGGAHRPSPQQSWLFTDWNLIISTSFRRFGRSDEQVKIPLST